MSNSGDTLTIGVPSESYPGERRVALVPAGVASLTKAGAAVLAERGAGDLAGYPGKAYEEAGARLVSRDELFGAANVVLQVRALGANPEAGRADVERMGEGSVLVAQADPLGNAEAFKQAAERGITAFALELIPRITRAQSMDVLSSMAGVAGYKAVLMAADALPKMFPMMMTAAGTIAPAKVFVIGAGVAGLQAIATAKRLGGVVSAYDVRPAVKDQVQSLGARFLELGIDTAGAEDKGGYAKERDESFYQKQREMMAAAVAESDVVIATAAVPGKKAPVLITREMVQGMKPGSVIVDLAAERGGNCECTRPGETADEGGVAVMGPLNLPSTVPFHASQMYSKNISTFVLNLIKEGKLTLDMEDEIVTETLICRGGQVVHPRVRELLGEPAPGAEGGNA